MLLGEVLKDLSTKIGGEVPIDAVLVLPTVFPEVFPLLAESLPAESFKVFPGELSIAALESIDRVVYGSRLPFRGGAFSAVICFAWLIGSELEDLLDALCKVTRKDGFIVGGTWAPGSFLGSRRDDLFRRQVEAIKRNFPERLSCRDLRVTEDYVLASCRCNGAL